MSPRKTAGKRARPSPAEPSAQSAEAQSRDKVPSPLFVATLPVRWRDLDAFNHVNNANYLTYLEESRLQWLSQVPGPWFDASSMPVLAASEINYRRPIAWPATLRIELQRERVGRSSITLAHRITDMADPSQLYADGRVVMVWMDPSTGQSTALPAAIRDAAGLSPS